MIQIYISNENQIINRKTVKQNQGSEIAKINTYMITLNLISY